MVERPLSVRKVIGSTFFLRYADVLQSHLYNKKHINVSYYIYIIVMNTDEKIKVLEEENARLKEELQATKEHLKKYDIG
jgi:hypothetical protein